MPGLFQVPIRTRRPVPLRPATLRDFSGGWNAVDSDEVLATKFSVISDNMMVGTDASVGNRFGTEFHTNVAGVVTGNIVNMIYFADALIAVTDTGQIAAIDGDGNIAAIWNYTIAATLPSSPPGWKPLTQVTFVPFKKELVIHNGINKPITIDEELKVTYLQDLAAGTDIWVPIGKYGCTVANYHVVAGIVLSDNTSTEPNTTQINISSAGTAGVFQGAAAPNDGVNIDVGAYTSLQAKEIRGVAGYRNFLMVFFRDSTLIITLGNYKDGVHVPLYNDTLPRFGLLSQRCILYLENDIFFGSPHGLSSARRNIFAGLIESKTLSEIIKPAFNQVSRALDEDQEKFETFIVRDLIADTIYLFIGGIAFAYTFNDTLKVRGWSRVKGWSWTCGCESKQGRTFFAQGTKIFRLGNLIFEGEEVYADLRGDRDHVFTNGGIVFAGNKVYDSLTNKVWVAPIDTTFPGVGTFEQFLTSTPDVWVEYFGEPVAIDWELPWTDLREPEKIKFVRTVKMASQGTARFTLSVYVDGLYKDSEGDIIHEPALQEVFVGGSLQGFGGSPEQRYGGGRNSFDPRLYKFPVRFKRMKLKITGTMIREKIRFSWFTFMHHRGSMHRP